MTPLDVSGQFPYVVSHRILLSGTAKMEKKTKKQIIDEIIKNTEIPPMGRDTDEKVCVSRPSHFYILYCRHV